VLAVRQACRKPTDTSEDGPRAPGPLSWCVGTNCRESIFPRMNHLSQIASAVLVLIFAAAMWVVGKSYAESQASKMFVVPAKHVVQAR
jgi:hypothetical protein